MQIGVLFYKGCLITIVRAVALETLGQRRLKHTRKLLRATVVADLGVKERKQQLRVPRQGIQVVAPPIMAF